MNFPEHHHEPHHEHDQEFHPDHRFDHNRPHESDENVFKKLGRWVFTFAVGVTALGFITAASAVALLSFGLPDVTKLETFAPAESTQIFDREGNLLYTIHGDENRARVSYENITTDVINATVAIEDNSFWEHGGFDLGGVVKAAMHEILGIGVARGGSTITQQYIKNTFLSPERSYLRKAKELILAVRLERAYTKKQIMELYLNRIPYGNNAYGAEKASEIYFGKTAKELDLAQSAVLASLPQAPSRYNPYGSNKFSHLLKEFTIDELHARSVKSEGDLEIEEYARGLIGAHIKLVDGTTFYIPGRTDLVLKAMYDYGEITADQRQTALNELQVLQFNVYKERILHPHFVFYIKQLLEDKYTKDIVERGGLKVYTTLDPKLQNYAEEVVTAQGEYNQKTYATNNAAVFAINSKTGQILTMVGSKDYYNEEIDGNVNVVLRPRQPGSSFKPIVYAQAFYNGYAPGSIIYDVPTRIGPNTPQNFNGQFMGQLTIRRALGQSRNIPAIKAYFLAGQQDAIIDLAKKMGITSLNKNRSYGYPLAIGSGEVPLFEMVSAYATFANYGKKPNIVGILKVENSNGDVLEEWKQQEFEEIIDPQIAYMISSILSDSKNSIGQAIYVDGRTNAAKTGTSTKQNKQEAKGAVLPMDDWTLGYTPTITVGVWAGNTDGSGLGPNSDGYNAAAPIFKKVLAKAIEGTPNESFVEPPGIKHVQVSKASGKLPGPGTPKSMVVTDIFSSFSVPTEIDDSFYTVKIDKISGLLATEFTPPDAVEEVTFMKYQDIADMFNWNNEVQAFYKNKSPEDLKKLAGKEGEDMGSVRFGMPPTEYDNIHTPENAGKRPAITITNPVGGAFLPVGGFEVDVNVEAANGVKSVEYYVNDKKEYTAATAPYSGHLNISKFMKAGDKVLIVAKVIDVYGYSSQSAIEVKVQGENDAAVQPKAEEKNNVPQESSTPPLLELLNPLQPN